MILTVGVDDLDQDCQQENVLTWLWSGCTDNDPGNNFRLCFGGLGYWLCNAMEDEQD